MSEGPKYPYDYALNAAQVIVNHLRPVCQRIEIAGSLRREKDEVGDIEIVAIPQYSTDLFANQFYSAGVIGEVLHNRGFKMDKDGENYKKFYFEFYNIWVDLFLTTPEQWGLIFMIRTGSADFSRLMVTPRNKYGHMPSNLHVAGGRVHDAIGNVLDTPEEVDIFRLWGMEFIEPKNRKI